MSTIKVSTVSNLAGTNSTSADNVISGSAKAWVNFNGTGTVAIRASYNVSSITDNGTGNYTVNFTSAFADADYCATVIAAGSGYNSCTTYSPSTTTLNVAFPNPVAANQDQAYVNIAFFR